MARLSAWLMGILGVAYRPLEYVVNGYTLKPRRRIYKRCVVRVSNRHYATPGLPVWRPYRYTLRHSHE